MNLYYQLCRVVVRWGIWLLPLLWMWAGCDAMAGAGYRRQEAVRSAGAKRSPVQPDPRNEGTPFNRLISLKAGMNAGLKAGDRLNNRLEFRLKGRLD